MKPLTAIAAVTAVAAIAAVLLLSPKDEPYNIIERDIPSFKNVTASDCADARKLKLAKETLLDVLGEYPAPLVKAASIKAIYICRNLQSYITIVAGSAVNAGDETYLYVNADYADKDDHFRRTLHHELFHALEYAHPVDEAAWLALNPLQNYLRDAAGVSGVVRYAPGEVPFEPGFVSDYARFSAREDRAELFAALMRPKVLSRREAALLRGDVFIKAKQQFLSAYVKELSGVDILGERSLTQLDAPYGGYSFTALYPDQVRLGPGENYEAAGIKKGEPLTFSGMEQDGVMLLFSESGQRVYAPKTALIKTP